MNTPIKSHSKHKFGSMRPYVVGFLLSLILTIGSYLLVVNHVFESTMLIASILFLAVIQLIVQLLFFLHLGQEQKPRWNLVFFMATVGIILLVVIGSIWIMDNLNYNMTPQYMDKVIMQDEGISPQGVSR